MISPGIDRDRVNPEYMDDIADNVANVVRCIQNDLTVALAQAFNVGRMGTPSNAWRATMLARLGGFTSQALSIIQRYATDQSTATRQAIRTATVDAIRTVEPELAHAVAASSYVPRMEVTQQRVVDAYAAQALNRTNLVNTVMLNSTLNAYREICDDVELVRARNALAQTQQTLNVEAGHVIVGGTAIRSAVRSAVIDIADAGLTGFVDRAGRHWSADAYVMMDIRTTCANAAREASFQRNGDYGNNLISVSSHAGARKLCWPYQGGVYSTDGTSGTCTDLNGTEIAYTPLTSTSYGQPAGLFGINCGHFNYPFVSGYSLVRKGGADPGKATNDAHYQLSQQQRAQERKVRQLTTRANALAAAGLKEDASAMRERSRLARVALRDWCAKNGRTFRPDRCAVTRTPRHD